MNRTELYNLAFECGWKPGFNDPASIMMKKVREKLGEYLDTPEGAELIRNTPKDYDFASIGSDGTPKVINPNKEITLEKLMGALSDYK